MVKAVNKVCVGPNQSTRCCRIDFNIKNLNQILSQKIKKNRMQYRCYTWHYARLVMQILFQIPETWCIYYTIKNQLYGMCKMPLPSKPKYVWPCTTLSEHKVFVWPWGMWRPAADRLHGDIGCQHFIQKRTHWRGSSSE